MVIVDYAHTPDALQQALQALRAMAKARSGKLQVLFGCGGDRDQGKRALMGGVAAQLADAIMLTSDNPRSEAPQVILDDILHGVPPGYPALQIEVDRALAIQQLIAQAGVRDVLLLAGKGHETTQEVAGVRTPFSDLEQAQRALQQRGQSAQEPHA
jgi:UDP-N-acetylmuramoyl-L-alanyl-D-glutamate--2,6-diaminopimelate ligase